jgi:hypothetical protein
MEMDIIRIKTLTDGKRIGTLVSSDCESKIDLDGIDHNDYEQTLNYKIFSKNVALFEIESLNDGDYNITSFERVYIAAPFVAEGQPLPTMSNEDCYRYVDTDHI